MPVVTALPATAPRPRAVAEPALPFSVCTLVSDRAQHAAMVESFAAGGFDAATAEFLFLDNSAGNQWDAYTGLPRLLAAARGRHAILCHQDVRLLRDGAPQLLACLADLDARDPNWALAGNAGARADGRLALRITDPHGADQHRGPLPAQVESLDENFIVLRRDAPIGLSADLAGFHLYGADLCLHARLAGRSAWVVDFHLQHLSPGRVDAGFLAAQEAFQRKWAAQLRRTAPIHTTCTRLDMPGNALGRWLAGRRLARRGRKLPG